jgi:uroporphyrinogen-III synthase
VKNDEARVFCVGKINRKEFTTTLRGHKADLDPTRKYRRVRQPKKLEERLFAVSHNYPPHSLVF